MTKTFLLIGGILNIFFTLFHILMGVQIQLAPGLDENARILIQMLNVGVVLFLAFAAYASFFCGADLKSTRLGKSFMVLVALFYAARAIEEIILSPAFSVLIFALCLVVALVYAAAAFWRAPQPAAA